MNIFRPTTKDKICFVHVPKCGGQSIKSAIGGNYNSRLATVRMKAAPSLNGSLVEGRNHQKLNAYREDILRYFLSDPSLGLVMGHYPCRRETLSFFSAEWKFVTILRNPVDRFISHYLYNTFKKSEHFQQDQPLDEFLETPRAEASGQMYVRYFSHFPNEGSLTEGIDVAKQVLDDFSLVGTLENLDDWKVDYQCQFGGKLKIGRTNSSPSGAKRAKNEITKDQMDRIQLLCKSSMEVYSHVLAKKG